MATDAISRFSQSQLITVDGITTYGKWTRPDWMKEENIASTEILLMQIDQQYAGRPDLIAEKYYGTPYLEWVITMFNRPLNTLGFPKAGSVIKILSHKIVFSNI